MRTTPQMNKVPQNVGFIRGDFDDKFAPYKRMANTIIDLTRKNGGCEPQDLLALGFTKQETIDLWHMSNAMANVELKLAEHISLQKFA